MRCGIRGCRFGALRMRDQARAVFSTPMRPHPAPRDGLGLRAPIRKSTCATPQTHHTSRAFIRTAPVSMTATSRPILAGSPWWWQAKQSGYPHVPKPGLEGTRHVPALLLHGRGYLRDWAGIGNPDTYCVTDHECFCAIGQMQLCTAFDPTRTVTFLVRQCRAGDSAPPAALRCSPSLGQELALFKL